MTKTKADSMNYSKAFHVKPGHPARLDDFDPAFTDKHEKKATALAKIEKLQQKMDALQFRAQEISRGPRRLEGPIGRL